MSKLFTVFLLAALIVGCASTGVKVKQEDIAKLKKGVTTEAQVREIFGAPNNVSLTSEGEKLFNYTYAKSTAKAQNFIPYVGAFMGGSDNEMEMLQIWFDKNGKVKNHTFNQSETETKAGLLAN